LFSWLRLGVPPSLLFSSLSFLRLRLLARQKRWEEEGRAINPFHFFSSTLNQLLFLFQQLMELIEKRMKSKSIQLNNSLNLQSIALFDSAIDGIDCELS